MRWCISIDAAIKKIGSRAVACNIQRRSAGCGISDGVARSFGGTYRAASNWASDDIATICSGA